MEPVKRCPDCGEQKSLSAFGNNRQNRDGLQVYCKACCSRRSAALYRKKRALQGKSVRERIEVAPGHKYCPGCRQVRPFSEWHRHAKQSGGLSSYCKLCRREQGRRGHLKRKFGLTPDEFASLIERQRGTCAICDGPPQHIDHDHATGAVRGILCGPCNMGLGQFRDDPTRLRRAADYLRRHGMRSVVAVDEYAAPEHVVFEVAYRHRSA